MYSSEGPSCPSRAHVVTTALVGVTPQKITNGSIVRNLLNPVKFPDMIKGIDVWGQSPMGSKDLILHYSCQGKIVKEVSEHFPCVCVLILPDTLIVETVVLSNCSRLMIPSQNSNPVFITHLQGQQQAHSLH